MIPCMGIGKYEIMRKQKKNLFMNEIGKEKNKKAEREWMQVEGRVCLDLLISQLPYLFYEEMYHEVQQVVTNCVDTFCNEIEITFQKWLLRKFVTTTTEFCFLIARLKCDNILNYSKCTNRFTMHNHTLQLLRPIFIWCSSKFFWILH